MKWFLIYLLAVNCIGGAFFVIDKWLATRGRQRISEVTLHLMELLGGVPLMLIFMYAFHHKNKKASYFLITWLILLLWVAALAYLLVGSR